MMNEDPVLSRLHRYLYRSKVSATLSRKTRIQKPPISAARTQRSASGVLLFATPAAALFWRRRSPESARVLSGVWFCARILCVYSFTRESTQSQSMSLMCDVCKEVAVRYKCPRCLKKTCCLACVKQHKTADGCSGVRDKTAYVAMKQFSEMHLLNDYRFLEDVIRKADTAARDIAPRKRDRSKYQNMMIREAWRRDVKLRIMPQTFSKRKLNRTWYHSRSKKMLWHIEFYFPHAAAKYTDRVDEGQCLDDVLKKFLHPTESDPVIQQHLKMYSRAGGNGVRVFMRQEGLPANCIRYDELDVMKTIQENLAGKTVFEYPTFHIVLKDRAENYTDKLDVGMTYKPSVSINTTPPSNGSPEDVDKDQLFIVSPELVDKEQSSIVSPEHVDKEQSSIVSPEHVDKEQSSIVSSELVDKEQSSIVSPELVDKEQSSVVSPEHVDKEQSSIVSPELVNKEQSSIVSPELVDKEQSSIVSPEHVDKEQSSVVSPELVDKEQSSVVSLEHVDKEHSSIVSPEHVAKEQLSVVSTEYVVK
ncbi:hypothetical protein LSAT2_031323 [Lamellibrachia satsuma]|nr:hypothetical protein LSAT2_031323 [Lamellibrachia satsuma]